MSNTMTPLALVYPRGTFDERKASVGPATFVNPAATLAQRQISQTTSNFQPEADHSDFYSYIFQVIVVLYLLHSVHNILPLLIE